MYYFFFINWVAIIYTLFTIYGLYKFLKRKKTDLILQSIVIYIVFLIILYITNRYNIYVNRIFIILSFITVLGHSFIGKALDFYKKFRNYDRLLHFFGTFSFSLFSFDIFYKSMLLANTSGIYKFIITFSFGITLGAFVELIEFIADIFTKQQNQKGLMDTNFDILFNIMGAFLAGILIIFI
jgi:hypothetical protein